MPEHVCHARGCEVPVPRKMFMCQPHWFSLPQWRRHRIWDLYQPGQENGVIRPSNQYLEAADEAIRYLAEHP